MALTMDGELKVWTCYPVVDASAVGDLFARADGMGRLCRVPRDTDRIEQLRHALATARDHGDDGTAQRAGQSRVGAVQWTLPLKPSLTRRGR